MESFSGSLERADICRAYIRSETFRCLFGDLFSTQIKTRVLARLVLTDFLCNQVILKLMKFVNKIISTFILIKTSMENCMAFPIMTISMAALT